MLISMVAGFDVMKLPSHDKNAGLRIEGLYSLTNLLRVTAKRKGGRWEPKRPRRDRVTVEDMGTRWSALLAFTSGEGRSCRNCYAADEPSSLPK
jgi:hypothetical protein